MRLILSVNGTERPRGKYPEGFQERLDLDVHVSGSSLPGKLLHYGLAAIAWLFAAGLSYLIMRSPHALADLLHRIEGQTTAAMMPILAMANVLALIALIAIGHLVFVRPLLMTTAVGGLALPGLLGSLWILGLVGGGYAGTRRRREALRWTKARLRAIEGSSSKLPAALSRPTTPAPSDAVVKAMTNAGLEIVRSKRELHLVKQGRVVVRIRPTKAAPWVPEDLKIEVRDRTTTRRRSRGHWYLCTARSNCSRRTAIQLSWNR